MKQNIYYTQNFGRLGTRKLSQFVVALLIGPKIILDVFMRRKMGERYFTLMGAAVMGLILFMAGSWADKMGMAPRGGMTSFYVFFVLYAIMSVVRYLEIRRAPSVFDFARFSLSSGIPYDFFFNIKITGKRPTLRTVEIFYEPLFCLIVGFIIGFLGQALVAIVIIICSIAYFLHNQLDATLGDHFVMDKIDEIICNQDMSQTFVQDKEMSDRQVPFFSKKPKTAELRQEFVDQMLNPDDDDEAAMAV